MDYERVYREFIADRRGREHLLEGYTEKHHILPRALGGGDEPENLIALTPEDHFFAHLVLAKAHGGKMWNALFAMAYLVTPGRTKHRKKFQLRFQFGFIRRRLAEHYREILSGSDGLLSSKVSRTLRSFDGREVSGNRFELEEQTGVTRQQISAVLCGAKMSAHGWYSPEHNPEGLTKSELLSRGISCKKVYNLYHWDGRVWSGVRSKFKADFGGDLIFANEDSHCRGWYRSRSFASKHFDRVGEKARRVSSARGCIKGKNNPMYGSDRRKCMEVSLRHKDGRTFSGNLTELADSLGLTPTQYGTFRKILLGKKVVKGSPVKSFHGWYAPN